MELPEEYFFFNHEICDFDTQGLSILDNNLLSVVSEYKFLGLIISKNLHFKHITYKIQKDEERLSCFSFAQGP